MKNCVKDKMDDSCAAQKHSGLGITEELSKSRQELSSLLHHSWVTPVKHKFANFQPQESTAVFTAKNLQASYCWRTQQSTKWQIKPCRGSALHCFSEMKPFHTRGEVEHGAKHSTAWGMLIILAKSLAKWAPFSHGVSAGRAQAATIMEQAHTSCCREGAAVSELPGRLIKPTSQIQKIIMFNVAKGY